MDDLGRIVIPRDIREAFGWGDGTKLEITITDITVKSIVVREVSPVSICQGGRWNFKKYQQDAALSLYYLTN